jgi:CMP-N,N'-diacetyllegionaminic acid synthase
LAGIPLMAYSIQAAKESSVFNKIMVSTDSEKYADIGCEYGAEVPFLRSKETSSDTAGSMSVVEEVLIEYKKRGNIFDTVCLLQPTSPLRTSQDIINSYKELEEKNADAITSVCELEHPPMWSMILPPDRSLKIFREKCNIMPRQGYDIYHRLNGAIYIRRIRYFDSGIEILAKNEYAYVMNKYRSIDIDEEIDFQYVEFLMSHKN